MTIHPSDRNHCQARLAQLDRASASGAAVISSSFARLAPAFTAVLFSCVAPVDDAPTCVPFDTPPAIFVERAGGTCGPLDDPGVVQDSEAPASVAGRRCIDTGWLPEGGSCVRGRVCSYRVSEGEVRVQSEARVDDGRGSLKVTTLASGSAGCRSIYDFPIAALRQRSHPPTDASAE